jgi:ATP-binding cassette subfamily B protein
MTEYPPDVPEGDDAPPPDAMPDFGPPSGWAALRLAASFLRYLRPVRGLVVLVILATGFGAVAELPMTFLPKVLTEHYQDPGYLTGYLGFVLTVAVVGWGLSVLLSYWSVTLGETLVRGVRADVFSKLERLSMLAVSERGPGEFVQNFDQDVNAVRGLIGETLISSGMTIAQGLAYLVSMLLLDWQWTVVILAGFLAMAGLVRVINRRVANYAAVARELMQQIVGRLVENVGGFRDIVASGRFQHFSRQFDHMLRASQRANIRTAVWGHLSGLLPAMMVGLAVIGVYWVGLKQTTDVSEIGFLITYTALVSQLFPSMLATVKVSTDLAMSMPSLLSLQRLLDLPPVQTEKTIPLKAPIRYVRFDHVTLEMEGRRIVENLTFQIPAGKFTAIVGQSGAGKTTVFHLLLRLLEPTSGNIWVNGHRLWRYTLDSLRATIGFLPQNPFFFNESLRENILLAAPHGSVSDKQLAHVLEMAQLHEVIENKREQGGLEAPAGYLGSHLSGGERQRLALARLLLRNPDMIVCDEYTANVDVKTAKLIHEAMRTHFAERTRVVITHELASVRGADHIIVIDHGRVVQQGSPEELRKQPGLYRELLEAQSV